MDSKFILLCFSCCGAGGRRRHGQASTALARSGTRVWVYTHRLPRRPRRGAGGSRVAGVIFSDGWGFRKRIERSIAIFFHISLRMKYRSILHRVRCSSTVSFLFFKNQKLWFQQSKLLELNSPCVLTLGKQHIIYLLICSHTVDIFLVIRNMDGLS